MRIVELVFRPSAGPESSHYSSRDRMLFGMSDFAPQTSPNPFQPCMYLSNDHRKGLCKILAERRGVGINRCTKRIIRLRGGPVYAVSYKFTYSVWSVLLWCFPRWSFWRGPSVLKKGVAFRSGKGLPRPRCHTTVSCPKMAVTRSWLVAPVW